MTEMSMHDLSLVYSLPFITSRSGRGRSHEVQIKQGKAFMYVRKQCKYIILVGVTTSLQIWGLSVGIQYSVLWFLLLHLPVCNSPVAGLFKGPLEYLVSPESDLSVETWLCVLLLFLAAPINAKL